MRLRESLFALVELGSWGSVRVFVVVRMVGVAHFSGGQWGRRRNAVGIALFLLYFCGSLVSLCCAGRPPAASRQELQVHKHLKRLNKAPVKSIQVYMLFS